MPDPDLPSDAFGLGTVTVVPSLNRLVAEGAPVDVEPRVMRVLTALAATPGEVVRRETLFETVWADTVVNDEALTRAVSELRRILRDHAGAPDAIETIRGSGYRLLLPVGPLPDVSPAAPLAPPVRRGQAVRRQTLPLVALVLAAAAFAVAVWSLVRDVPEDEAGVVDARTSPALDAVRDSARRFPAPSPTVDVRPGRLRPDTQRAFGPPGDGSEPGDEPGIAPPRPDTGVVRRFRRQADSLGLGQGLGDDGSF